MLQAVSLLLIGYSVFSALVIAVVHFRRPAYAMQPASMLLGVAVLFVLASMQLFHFAYLQYGDESLHGPVYRVLLFSVAPLFYLYISPVLKPQVVQGKTLAVHAVTLIAAPFITYTYALPLAFIVGAMYLLGLVRLVYALRGSRERYQVELALLGLIFVLGVMVAIAGMAISVLGEKLFYSFYSIAIGAAFLLVSIVLFRVPRFPAEVAEVARETYAVSTLANVDCDDVIARLAQLMAEEKIYTRPDLDLAGLAGQVSLNTHQLSELLNTRLGKSFPRYLREYRVTAASDMLLAEPSASVLSVGLSVGFNSQSGFYEAFREITGMTPGKFRQVNAP